MTPYIYGAVMGQLWCTRKLSYGAVMGKHGSFTDQAIRIYTPSPRSAIRLLHAKSASPSFH